MPNKKIKPKPKTTKKKPTKKVRTKSTKTVKKPRAEIKKITHEMDYNLKRSLMWLLVSIFSIIFIFFGFYSIKFQLSKPSGERNELFQIFANLSDYKDQFSITNDLETEIQKSETLTDEKIKEWEDKLFPEIKNE